MALVTLIIVYTRMHSECLKLGENYLLKVQLNDKEIETSDVNKFAIKPNGGEIAIHKEIRKQNFVNIYNGAGKSIDSIPISSGNIVELGWSQKEELLEIIYSDGKFQVLTDNYQNFTEISILGNRNEEDEIVLEAKLIEDDSVTVLTSENNFIMFDLFNMTKFKYVRPECLEFNSPQSWFPTYNESIVFALNSSLYKITNQDEMIQKNLSYGTICHLNIDKNSSKMLVLTSEYRLLVIDSELFNVELDINVQSEIDVFAVSEIHWLIDRKTSIIAISSSSTGKLVLLDINEGKFLHMSFGKNFSVVNETDGLRIFQNGRNWLLTLMPQIMINLTVSNSKLSEFFDLFTKKDFEGIRNMSRVQLSEIIDLSSKSLIYLSYEQNLQDKFITAVKYAVKVLEEKLGTDDNSRHTFSYITANFNRSLTECYVLKKLQDNGMTLSPDEFQENFTEEKILMRLCRLNLHGIAFEVAVLLEADISIILMDWSKKAIEKIKLEEKELWLIISDKLFTWINQNQKVTRIDYIQLAEIAIKYKKPKLALKLLKLEKDTNRKIELLVQLNEYREAVIESIQSKQSDQIKFVFDYLVKNLSLTEFFSLSNISESVKNSLISYCKTHNRVLLQILMYQDDKLVELMEELVENDLENLGNWFQLLRTQRLFEQKYVGTKFMGLSMTESLREIMSSKSFYSRSMGPSIEELKASRIESLNSPSSASILNPSSSGFGLNLPKEPIRTRVNLNSINSFADSRAFSAPNIVGPTTSNMTPQENLKNTAQAINGFIQKDKIKTDFGEFLNGQFSRDYIHADEYHPVLKFNKHSLIPEILLNQVKHSTINGDSKEGNTFMGLFPEIQRAWLTSGNNLYLWSFENNLDFTNYIKSQYEIIDVALVRPKAGIFNESVEWLVVVVTPMEIFLLAAVFKSPDQIDLQTSSNLSGSKNYSSLNLTLLETGFNFPSDEVNMVSVCGTDDGRIFLAGSDGNIYELTYQDQSDWFTSKCKKINRTASPLSYIVPTFLRASPSRACVVKLNYDASRHIIYGLTEQSTIHVYWLGPNGKDFEFVGVTGDLSSEAMKLTPAGIISSSKALNIVSIYPVDSSESDIISLVAICRSGIRLYFSIINPAQGGIQHVNQPLYQATQNQQPRQSQAPRGIRLVHLRAAPEENRVRDPKKLVHRWSPNIHCAFYSNGVTLAANTITNEEDLIIGMILNPSIGSTSNEKSPPIEVSAEIATDGKVWDIEELPSGEISTDSDIKGIGKEFALNQMAPYRSFAILTNVGVYMYSKLRPIDQLYLLLSESNVPADRLMSFFRSYGNAQSCAFCIALFCKSTYETRWNTFSTGPEASLIFKNNVLSILLNYSDFSEPQQGRNFVNLNQNAFGRDGIGRIITTQPEVVNSPMHEGFYIYFSRLVSSIWKRSLWDIKNIPCHLMIDLSRFYKFISENMNTFTEKRRITKSDNEEFAQRQQNAIEFENESLLRLKETSGLLIELLTFISICIDYKLLDLVRSEPIGIENVGMNIELILTSSKGKSLITDLGNILVQRQLRLRAPIRPLCDSLRSRCASFFSEEDVFLQEGMEALERTRLCRSPIERLENATEALKSLMKASKVIPVTNLLLILDQFDILGLPDLSIRLGLHFIEILDPENIGLQREINPNLQLNSDEHEICRQREAIYEHLKKSLSYTGFDLEKANSLLSGNPSINIDELRNKCLKLLASSRDELFHYRMYEWLVEQRYSQTLLDLPHNEFLYKYLRSTFISRDNSHRDLLWKWLARSHKFSEAASVLASIAESRDYLLSLSERIEFLSLAITHCKSAAMQPAKDNSIAYGFEEIPHIELSELEELLEVAHTQYEVLKEARNTLGGRNEMICAELDGLVGLLSVTDLFNRYARPYGLTESCLRLIHISGLVNERLVSQLWQEIISKYVNDNNSDLSAFHQLGSKISELARKFYPSPSAFPLTHLIDVLGRLALSFEIGADWLVAVLINSGIPLTGLADEFNRFFASPPSKSWLSPTYRIYLLEMIAVLYNIWSNDHIKVSAHNPMIVSRLKAYAVAASELQSSDLMNEFGSLLKHLANL